MGQEFDWERFVELWQAYRSGQFVSLSGFAEDWRDQSSGWSAPDGWAYGMTLSVESAVFLLSSKSTSSRHDGLRHLGSSSQWSFLSRRYTASKLTVSLLWNPGRVPFSMEKVCGVESWTYSASYQPATLLGKARELAAEPAVSLFELFRWDVSQDTIRGIQDKLPE